MFTVKITDKESGEARYCKYEEPWDEGEEYLWAEGNWSCDCNRRIFFERAVNPDWAGEARCGDSRYAVEICGVGGHILYQDAK